MTLKRWTEVRHGPDGITKGYVPSGTTAEEPLQSDTRDTKWPGEPEGLHTHGKTGEVTHGKLISSTTPNSPKRETINIVGMTYGRKFH